MKSSRWSFLRIAVVLLVVLAFGLTLAYAISVGQRVGNVEIRDANNNSAYIPNLGKKVISIFYNDADAADLNDPLADALKAKKFDESKYQGIGIANLKDSKAPNFIIRKIVQGKIEKYNSTILTDPDLILAKKWNLGNCNNTSVVLIIGKDKKVKYVTKGAVRGAEIKKVVDLVEVLTAGK